MAEGLSLRNMRRLMSMIVARSSVSASVINKLVNAASHVELHTAACSHVSLTASLSQSDIVLRS